MIIIDILTYYLFTESEVITRNYQKRGLDALIER